jgi:hypothetical protein
MAIAHILGRLAHFNSARDKSGEGWRLSGGQRDSQRPRTSIGRVLGRALLRCIGILRWTVMLAVLALIGWGVNYEMKTSYLEAWIFTRIDRDMSFAPQPGPSDSIRFPTHGPYDERLGYVAVPQFVSALSQRHFTVERQVVEGARPVCRSRRFSDLCREGPRRSARLRPQR